MINKILHIFKSPRKNLNDWDVLFTLDKACRELYDRGEISAARKAGVKKLVYAASSSCYGIASTPTSENHPILPN